MGTVIHNILTQKWELELGGTGLASIVQKNALGAFQNTQLLSAWVAQLAAAGQLTGTLPLGGGVTIPGGVGTVGQGQVQINLDGNNNRRLDFTDANSNGVYDAGETITENLQLTYAGYNVLSQTPAQVATGYAYFDAGTQTWVAGQSTGGGTPPITPPVGGVGTTPPVAGTGIPAGVPAQPTSVPAFIQQLAQQEVQSGFQRQSQYGQLLSFPPNTGGVGPQGAQNTWGTQNTWNTQQNNGWNPQYMGAPQQYMGFNPNPYYMQPQNNYGQQQFSYQQPYFSYQQPQYMIQQPYGMQQPYYGQPQQYYGQQQQPYYGNPNLQGGGNWWQFG